VRQFILSRAGFSKAETNNLRVNHSKRMRRGSSLLYAAVTMPIVFGTAAFIVDAGRVMEAKSELQAATDAAARYAATAMRTTSGGTSAAAANASAVFAQNLVDGSAAPFDPNTDLVIGIWNSNTRAFTPTTLAGGANAVRIQTRLALGGASRPLIGSTVGFQATVHASSTVMMNGRTASGNVTGKGNPWLAGMPDGTVSDNWQNVPGKNDVAGGGAGQNSSPGMIDLAAASMVGGATIMFDSVSGTTGNGSGNVQVASADGNANQIVSLGTNGTSSVYTSRPMHGMSNVRAPINSMIAVFLDDNAPNSTPAPAALDFMSTTQRDYQSISPLLKQTFFIGDGRRSSTGEVQGIVVPQGATRLFIGNMDAWQWNDNTGGYTATANSTISVTTVK
jgi:Flp pilus assembly protein TadG